MATSSKPQQPPPQSQPPPPPTPTPPLQPQQAQMSSPQRTRERSSPSSRSTTPRPPQQAANDHTVSTFRHRLSQKEYPPDCPPLQVRWYYAVDVIKLLPSPPHTATNPRLRSQNENHSSPTNPPQPVHQQSRPSSLPSSSPSPRVTRAQSRRRSRSSPRKKMQLTRSPRHTAGISRTVLIRSSWKRVFRYP